LKALHAAKNVPRIVQQKCFDLENPQTVPAVYLKPLKGNPRPGSKRTIQYDSHQADRD
jgi:hypothetical protein